MAPPARASPRWSRAALRARPTLRAGGLRALVLSQDVVDGLALVDNRQHPQGPIQLRRSVPLHLWFGSVDGQDVLAILETGAGPGAETFVDQAEGALRTLAPVTP